MMPLMILMECKMGKLILLNDVSTELEEANLLVGDSDPPHSVTGKQQSEVIAPFFHEKVPNIDLIFSSDARRIKKLVHRIRVDSKDQNLTNLTPRRLEALRERSFGVLNRTPYLVGSDIFRQTRIKPEKGESIFECRVRMMKCISNMVEKFKDKVVLLVSHSFACQIAFNAILQRDHTFITDFWTRKGSFVVFGFEFGKYGVRWNFDHAYNALSDISYTQDEIYSGILGKEGALPG